MNIKKIIKKVLPRTTVAKIKMGKDIIYYSRILKMLEEEQPDTDFIIGTPIHKNLGDHLITLAERELFRINNYKRKIIEIPTEMFQAYKKRLIEVIPQSSILFINGGGWMGNIWPEDELFLQEIVRSFQNNRIIIFPQTIFYDENIQPYKNLIESGNAVFSQCKKLTLCVREESSFVLAQKIYSNTKVILVPDIALVFYNKSPKNTLNGNHIVGYCLRKDREKSREAAYEDEIRRVFQDLNYQEKRLSTLSVFRTSAKKREKKVLSRLVDFAKCSIVVTDRLHGMIFAFLTGTPCIVFDNKTSKVSGVYELWLKEYKYILPIFSDFDGQTVREFIKQNCGKEHTKRAIFEKKFDTVMEEIQYG